MYEKSVAHSGCFSLLYLTPASFRCAVESSRKKKKAGKWDFDFSLFSINRCVRSQRYLMATLVCVSPSEKTLSNELLLWRGLFGKCFQQKSVSSGIKTRENTDEFGVNEVMRGSRTSVNPCH